MCIFMHNFVLLCLLIDSVSNSSTNETEPSSGLLLEIKIQCIPISYCQFAKHPLTETPSYFYKNKILLFRQTFVE